MPPPYTADKRIRDLNLQVTPLLNDFLAMDRTGALEATKITIQKLVDIVSPNTTKQFAYADTVAPDNALGNNGDFAFRVPVDGSELQMYQKISGVWSSVFNLPISSISSVSKTNADVDSDGNISYTPPTGKTVIGADIVQVVSSVSKRKNLFPSYEDGKLYGFEKLTDSDTQNIIIKVG